MSDQQIEDIKHWEDEKSLIIDVSDNYQSYLTVLIENRLVYESGWTAYNNPREYTLHESLKQYIFSDSFPYLSELNTLVNDYFNNCPFK